MEAVEAATAMLKVRLTTGSTGAAQASFLSISIMCAARSSQSLYGREGCECRRCLPRSSNRRPGPYAVAN